MVSTLGMKRAVLLLCTLATAAALALAGAAWAAVGSNPSPISIPGSGQATPYPATIDVANLSGPITDVNITLHGVSHTFADDVAVLLVGPSGQNVMLMSDAGGGQDLNGVSLTFDDEATRSLPDGAGTQITSGAYKPTQGANSANKVPSSLPSPAPAGPYGTSLSVFDGANPNGTYSLYVFDDAPGDAGQIAGGLSVDITAGTNSTTALNPDLRMARLENLQIQKTADGRKLLRFDSIVVNVGDGVFEARGSRTDTTSEMTVVQRVYDDVGGYTDRSTAARMYFAGDGHTHWHLRDLEDYTLTRLDNGTLVGTGAKHGFCFFDNYRFGSTQAAYYTSCGNNPDALSQTMGLSRGWGDIYRSTLPDQYIDITGLVSGRYRLRATADADNWFSELDNTNNFTWVNIQISGDSVSVLRYGPAAQPI